jgi:hypothetical protein
MPCESTSILAERDGAKGNQTEQKCSYRTRPSYLLNVVKLFEQGAINCSQYNNSVQFNACVIYLFIYELP